MEQSLPQGRYHFSRQEMVAGFEFLANSKFNFYYSYGAVDRTATGTFSVAGNKLTLKSNKEAGHDFTVAHQSKSGAGYTVKVECENEYLKSNIRCTFFIGNKRHDEFTNSKGEVKVGYPHVDKIYVFHALFPDMVTMIKDEHNASNHFTITLNPSLEQVSFKGIELKIENDSTLSCLPNYFMSEEDMRFKKE